jgi:hypothetical protein
MGNSSSVRNKQIQAQEEYVRRRMKDSDIQQLSKMRGGFFRPTDQKYNARQLEGYLRQEYNGTRKPDTYVLDRDLTRAGATSRRVR